MHIDASEQYLGAHTVKGKVFKSARVSLIHTLSIQSERFERTLDPLKQHHQTTRIPVSTRWLVPVQTTQQPLANQVSCLASAAVKMLK